MPRKLQLVGQRFTKLLVVAQAPSSIGRTFWECRCDCGNTVVVRGAFLTYGHVQSCGCYRIEQVVKSVKTHGASYTAEYRSWAMMIQRCHNPNAKGYKNYGGRGIKVCQRWRESFENFFADMGFKPTLKHTLDRVKTNGNYEPGNCRWATCAEQNHNLRKNVTITAFGKTMCAQEWGRETGLWPQTIANRIRAGMPPEIALTRMTGR